MNNNEFGTRLQGLRKEKSISQSELAKALECSTSSISKYELGIRTPDINFLDNAANFFGVSVDYLLGRSMVRTDEKTSLKSVCDYLGLSEKAVEEIKKLCTNSEDTASNTVFNYLCEEHIIPDITIGITNAFLYQAMLLKSAHIYKLSDKHLNEKELEQLKESKREHDFWETDLCIITRNAEKEIVKHFCLEPNKIDKAEYKELIAIIEELTNVPLRTAEIEKLLDF